MAHNFHDTRCTCVKYNRYYITYSTRVVRTRWRIYRVCKDTPCDDSYIPVIGHIISISVTTVLNIWVQTLLNDLCFNFNTFSRVQNILSINNIVISIVDKRSAIIAILFRGNSILKMGRDACLFIARLQPWLKGRTQSYIM